MSNRSLAVGQGSLSSFFNDFFEPWNDWFSDSRLSRSLTTPKANLSETSDNYNLSLAAPGIRKEDIDISLNGNVLTVSAHHETDKEATDEKYHRQEYNYTSFSRSFTLPDNVAADKIAASYDGGVLKITLPKNQDQNKNNDNKIQVN